MFTEKEIAVAVTAGQYDALDKAYKSLASFLAGSAKITFNAIRIANGFDADPTFEKLIEGTTPTPPPGAR